MRGSRQYRGGAFRRRAGYDGVSLRGQRVCPAYWGDGGAWERWPARELERNEATEEYLLCRRRQRAFPTPEGLHHAGSRADSVERLDVLVGDGGPSVEVTTVRRLPGYRWNLTRGARGSGRR